LNRLVAALALLLVSAAARAEIKVEGHLVQGGLVQGSVAPGSTLALDGERVRVAKDGRFVVGFGRDAKASHTLVAKLPDGRTETRKLKIEKRVFDVQRVDGLPQDKVTPPASELDRIRDETALIVAGRNHDTPTPWFEKGFVWPAQGRISGVYGSQRILNGEPRAPHLGLDIAAPVGTPVVAAAEGIVRLEHTDMFYTGGTLIIDHGHGVSTLYIHLSAVEVKTGERVKQGQRIGAVGMTGRATGPHLHWGLHWFDVKLDPALVVGPMPDQVGALPAAK
jgi:murein DD-endopeptidase MepM/ murein hydrolase activator NlpD